MAFSCDLSSSTLSLNSFRNSLHRNPYSSFHIFSLFLQYRLNESVTRACCISFSGSWLYGRASSAYDTFYSSSTSFDDGLKFLPSGQIMIISKIPWQLQFPVQVRCVISTTHLVTSVVWCVQGTFALNIQPGTDRMPEVVLQCKSLLKQLTSFHKLPVSLFQLGV